MVCGLPYAFLKCTSKGTVGTVELLEAVVEKLETVVGETISVEEAFVVVNALEAEAETFGGKLEA